jgi:hypothetical protein
VDATRDHQTSRVKASEIMIHNSTVKIDDRQMQGCIYARRRLPSSLRGSVDDIAASKDILGEIILYKPLLENIIVYYIVGSLIYNNIIL